MIKFVLRRRGAKQNGLDSGVEEFLKMFCEAAAGERKIKVFIFLQPSPGPNRLDAEEEEEEDLNLSWRPLPLIVYFTIYFCQNLNRKIFSEVFSLTFSLESDIMNFSKYFLVFNKKPIFVIILCLAKLVRQDG